MTLLHRQPTTWFCHIDEIIIGIAVAPDRSTSTNLRHNPSDTCPSPRTRQVSPSRNQAPIHYRYMQNRWKCQIQHTPNTVPSLSTHTGALPRTPPPMRTNPPFSHPKARGHPTKSVTLWDCKDGNGTSSKDRPDGWQFKFKFI